jgi:RNA polymerase sigma-70 factor (ECF subfamily)
LIFREVEDRDLVLAARKGDVEAYNQLVSRWEKRVYNYLLRVVKDREDALDLTQETFLKAYRYLGKLDDADCFPRWLFRIAHNEAFSQFRREKPESQELSECGGGRAIPIAGSAVYPLELELAVRSSLEQLSAEQREAVVLKIYQGFKFDEIAQIQSCPVSTVKSRLYAAFDLLKVLLTTGNALTTEKSVS